MMGGKVGAKGARIALCQQTTVRTQTVSLPVNRSSKMNLRDMTRQECETMLAVNQIGHLGCICDERPYVVPIRYAFRDGAFYSFSLPGKKIDSLRLNPHACVQIEQLVTPDEWQSVLLEGRYQELPDDEKWHDEHMYAWSLLQQRANWWEPGMYKSRDAVGLTPVFYSIQIEVISGRHATRD
jgi:nitroimidazol reductase NimA-like FMN-containing flavoprotein (pyridoxamine 5'-phosphate oxidase superfamily)